MIQTIKKRTLFFLSILVTGLVGIISSYIRTNYSKDSSLIVPTANADYTAYTADPGSCGDGCGGCSGSGDSSK